MAGRLINGEKYVGTWVKEFREQSNVSFEDEVYFMLCDLFQNLDIHYAYMASCMISDLTNGVRYQDRDEAFKYANLLYDCNSDFSKRVKYLFDRYVDDKDTAAIDFENDELNEGLTYIKYDEWWGMVEQFVSKLNNHVAKLYEMK